ncbi:MAG: M20/M25/M40 family metallo-hydrolase [Nitrososphaeria archaeon]|nr:M20/M25/M40 family metallo-hydrolase [Nitrososphaeria archaeon]
MHNLKKVDEWIEDHRNEITNFCCKLIEYKSITGFEEEVQKNFLFPFIEKELDFEYKELYYASSKERRPNIICFSKGEKNGLLLNGHVDVVDVPENQLSRWQSNPWSPIIKDKKIFGRGASDMKGGITCMLWAIKALQSIGWRPKNLGLELVVGEEHMDHNIGTTAATKRLLDNGCKFDFCLSLEPTNCEIHVESCGTFDFEVIVEGKETHTANRNVMLYPQRLGIPCGDEVGVDAISKIIDIVRVLQKLERETVINLRNQVIGVGGLPVPLDLQGLGAAFTINVSFIEGGSYIASVAGNAKITCQCYYPPQIGYEETKKLILETIESYSKTDSWLKNHPPQLTFAKRFHWPPYQTDIGHPAVKILAQVHEKVTRKKVIFSGNKGVNDLTFLQKLGISGVTYGPGNIFMNIHGPNEYIPIDQLVEGTKILAHFLTTYCG